MLRVVVGAGGKGGAGGGDDYEDAHGWGEAAQAWAMSYESL